MIQSSRLHHWLPLPQVPTIWDEGLSLYSKPSSFLRDILMVVTRKFCVLQHYVFQGT